MTYKGIGECRAITLTVGADTLSPNSAVAANKTTSGDDLIRAVIDNSLETKDSIDGGAGNDTIKANVSATGTAAVASTAGTAATTTIQPLLTNVENVYLNATVTGGAGAAGAAGAAGGNAAVTFDATDSTGLKAVWSEGSTVTPGATNTGAGGTATLTFQNLALGTEVGVKDTTSGATFSFKSATGAADAATLNLADASGSAAVTIAAIENLTIKSNAGSLSNVTVNNAAVTAAQAETVTISGDQALTLNLTAGNIKTIDAGSFGKALDLTFAPAANKPVTVTGGSGADTFNLSATNAAKVTLNAGAGNDTVNLNSDAFHAITLGDGIDQVNLNTYTSAKAIDTTTGATLAASVIEITDFKSGTDVLKIDAVSGAAAGAKKTVTGTELTFIASQSNLKLAAEEAAKKAGADGDVVAFQYGSDTYVLVNESGNDATLDTSDVLIKLTGVTSVIAADILVV